MIMSSFEKSTQLRLNQRAANKNNLLKLKFGSIRKMMKAYIDHFPASSLAQN